MNRRPPESEARKVISAMLVLTALIAVLMIVLPGLSTGVRSALIVAWIAVMMAVLRRYRL